MKFDISVAFDKTTYLNSEIPLYVNSLKEHIPKDTVLHITTNRSRKSDMIKYMRDNLPCKVYHNPKPTNLRSRCGYLTNSFEVKTDKEWVLKTDLDIIFLNDMTKLEEYLRDDLDVVIQPENRRIIPDDKMENRIWRLIYRRMKIKMGEDSINSVEGNQLMKPLYNTGIFALNKRQFDNVNKDWKPLTRICENWIHFGIHPNEFAFTGMMYKYNMKKLLLPETFSFNPIGNFRKGEFPSTDLVDNAILPNDINILHYHKPQWLNHIYKYNPNVKDIVSKSMNMIKESWWTLDNSTFQEKA